MTTRWAPVGVAVAVMAVVAGVTLLTNGGGSDEPPLLRLATGAAEARGAAPQADSATSGKLGAPSSAFQLAGPLPDGPDEARAHPLPDGAGPVEDVRRLAKALGVTGEPVRAEQGWRVGGLYVGAGPGRPWSLSPCGPGTPVASDGAPDVACSSGSSGSSGSGTVDPVPPVAPVVSAPPPLPLRPVEPDVDPAVLRRAAAPVLEALGLAGAALHVEAYGRQGAVTADPVVGGLPTSGYATRLDLTADGTLLGASGYLAEPAAGPSYPLISAKAAFEALAKLPQPLSPECEGCPTPAAAKVTGARLGLLMTAMQDGAALLPAWLFTVEDWPMPLPQNAVVERYLERPGEPSAPPTGSRQSFGFDAAYPTDDPKTVIVQYGDSGSCPREQVTHAVKESDESVVVMLEADAQPTEQACTSDYRQVLVTVALQAPLGTRTLLDASRGEEVAVDRSCSRPMGNPPPPKDCVG